MQPNQSRIILPINFFFDLCSGLSNNSFIYACMYVCLYLLRMLFSVFYQFRAHLHNNKGFSV